MMAVKISDKEIREAAQRQRAQRELQTRMAAMRRLAAAGGAR